VSVEIERRFLVEDPEAAIAQAVRSSCIRQGYVAIDPAGMQVRVREIGERRLLTVKRGSGEVRAEVEFEIDAAKFEELWELTAGRRIDKRRHFIRAGDLVFELDVYAGDLAGLAVVEVEADSPEASAAFEPPAWFGRELTGDERYSNVRLAVDGLPD
jgi:CYTH domain-containing protein